MSSGSFSAVLPASDFSGFVVSLAVCDCADDDGVPEFSCVAQPLSPKIVTATANLRNVIA
jgi:hypothetical protein